MALTVFYLVRTVSWTRNIVHPSSVPSGMVSLAGECILIEITCVGAHLNVGEFNDRITDLAKMNRVQQERPPHVMEAGCQRHHLLTC